MILVLASNHFEWVPALLLPENSKGQYRSILENRITLNINLDVCINTSRNTHLYLQISLAFFVFQS